MALLMAAATADLESVLEQLKLSNVNDFLNRKNSAGFTFVIIVAIYLHAYSIFDLYFLNLL